MATSSKTIFRKDYQEPSYTVKTCHLDFDVHDDHVIVSAQLEVLANPNSTAYKKAGDFHLDGENLELLSLAIDGRSLEDSEYRVEEGGLVLLRCPGNFTLESKVRIDPYNNKSLEGIYLSGDILCSQNEATGFRHITYYPDRPDVMAVFTVKITADEKKFPILLSNGNLVKREELVTGRTRVTWHDPFPKPSYLFAFVAGDLDCLEDEFTSMSGRKIRLEIYTDKGRVSEAFHAMDSLKLAMQWDEENFGREYDLDLYMIVAVDSFNFGAMENKGLNIFNSSLVFASEETATDEVYERIASVVAHEYFHNWTGNRITCRDWFQLTLKEGLTVYRDQLFSETYCGHQVMRIEEVAHLRNYQYPEDAGPNRHPIRPESFVDINNFYTQTVYQKGAAVIRMLASYLGKEAFRRGMDYYFATYDGKAITCDDFVSALEQGAGSDLSAFKGWYSQAGTPQVYVEQRYDSQKHSLIFSIRQEYKQAGEGNPALGFPFPLVVYNQDGQQVAEHNLIVTEQQQELQLEVRNPSTQQKFIPSFLQDHISPLEVHYKYSAEELLLLIKHDKDPFNRYEAMQNYCIYLLTQKWDEASESETLEELCNVYRYLLEEQGIENRYLSLLLGLPSLQVLAEKQIHLAQYPKYSQLAQRRKTAYQHLGSQLHEPLEQRYHSLAQAEYQRDTQAIAKRSLRNTLLFILGASLSNDSHDIAFKQYQEANNMSDSYAALRTLCYFPGQHSRTANTHFENKWKDNFLVISRWFALQVSIPSEEVLEKIPQLARHPSFRPENPNMIRSLYSTLAGNLSVFHHKNGEAYRIVAEEIMRCDAFNSMTAAGLAKAFVSYKYQDPEAQGLIKRQIEGILALEGISSRVNEILSKTLAEVSDIKA